MPFFSLWYDSTWDWTQVSRTLDEQSTHLTKSSFVYIYVINLVKKDIIAKFLFDQYS